MNSCTVAELGRNASRFCGANGPLVITVNGRPQNLMLNIAGLGLDEVVDLARTAAATSALARLRTSAEHSGASMLSDDEIAAEIDAVRSAE